MSALPKNSDLSIKYYHKICILLLKAFVWTISDELLLMLMAVTEHNDALEAFIPVMFGSLQHACSHIISENGLAYCTVVYWLFAHQFP